MTTIVTCGITPAVARRLAGELGATTHVLACQRMSELPHVMRDSDSRLVFCDTVNVDVGWLLALSAVCSLIHTMPRVTAIVNVPQSAATPARIVQISREGARRIDVPAVDDPGATLVRAWIAVSRRTVASTLVELLRPAFSERAIKLIARCLAHTGEPISVLTLAERLGMSRRTLARRCAHLRLPSPELLIAWCRLMQCWRAARNGHQSFGVYAKRYGFAGASDVRTRVKRHTRLTFEEVRARGGLAAVFRDRYGTASIGPAPRTVEIAKGLDAVQDR